jgi:hypothetical protein
MIKKWLVVKMLSHGGLAKTRHSVNYSDFPTDHWENKKDCFI